MNSAGAAQVPSRPVDPQPRLVSGPRAVLAFVAISLLGLALLASTVSATLDQTVAETAGGETWSDAYEETSAEKVLTIVINEVGWMGTAWSATHEWIELYNTTASTISLAGYSLAFQDGSPQPISLTGSIAPRGHSLLERYEHVVGDITADLVYSVGPLDDAGEGVILLGPSGAVIDTANGDGGGWPAGVIESGTLAFASMERRRSWAPDDGDNWCTNDGETRNGTDGGGSPVNGTPRSRNSCYVEAPPATADLVLAKSGPIAALSGETVTYFVVLTNSGALTAHATVMTDRLPVGTRFVAQAGPFPWTLDGHDLVWQIDDVSPGERVILAFSVAVGAAPPCTLTNRVTVSTWATETILDNNSSAWWTAVRSPPPTYVPIALGGYRPPLYGVIIEAVLYDGLQLEDYDEAVLLLNGYDGSVDLAGWQLCKWLASSWSCANLPSRTMDRHERLWLARSEPRFEQSFGHAADAVLSGWPQFANAGDEVVLRRPSGTTADSVVYGDGELETGGWKGAAIRPYTGPGFAASGQIIYRIPDETTGLPASDTDSAADWAQYPADATHGRRVRYPGWDLETFSIPAVSSGATVTAAIAPDSAYSLVVDTIRSARRTLDLEVYTLEHYGVVSELVTMAHQGVTVTVLLEGAPVGGVSDQELWACEQLHESGRGRCYFMVNSDTARIFDRYDYVHAKSILVDNERLLVGSQNLTLHGLPGDRKDNGTGGSRGVVLVTDAPEIVARAAEIFEADCDPSRHEDVSMWGPDNVRGFWMPPPGFQPVPVPDYVSYTVLYSDSLVVQAGWLELVTAPESSLRTADSLLGLIGRAGVGDGVYVEQLYEHRDWGDPSTAPNLRLQAYIAAARRGARVRILLNGGRFGVSRFPLTENIATAAYVNQLADDEGLDVAAHLADPTYFGVHAKTILVDLGPRGKYIHVGSINGSETASKVNREIALQVRSEPLFDYLLRAFEDDWDHEPPLVHPLVSEIMYAPSDSPNSGEWVELYNPTAEQVALSGWHLGDVDLKGEYGSGLYRFPEGALLPAGGVIVIAQQAADIGFTPDFEFLVDPNRDDPDVPNMNPVDPEAYGFALGNGGDEVLLLNADGEAVDVVTYGDGSYAGVVPHPGVAGSGRSLERRPPDLDTDDCSADFYDRYPPTPGALP